MAKRGVMALLGALVVAGCGMTPATAPEMSTKGYWGWGGGATGPVSGVDAYLQQGRPSQAGWGSYSPFNWNAYYPNWIGPSPYYLPPVYKTDFGNFSYFAAPAFPYPYRF